MKRHESFSLAVSATTRAPRPKEKHGEDYYFLTSQVFDQLIQEEAFLEWCEVHESRYGTLKKEVDRKLALGRVLILEIDTCGAEKIRQKRSDIVSVFIAPPSISVLKNRLVSRNTETSATINTRLQRANEEMGYMKDYDYVVINQTIDESVSDILTIINKEISYG